jgi:hypothetical protein
MKHTQPARIAAFSLFVFLSTLPSVSAQNSPAQDMPAWASEARLGFHFSGPTPTRDWNADGEAVASTRLTLPAFRGKGILYDTNHIALAGDVALSSANLELGVLVRAQPIQMFSLELGNRLGTGWTAASVSGRIVGLGINPAKDAEPIREIPFGGFLWTSWVSAKGYFSLEQALLNPWWRIYLELDPTLQYQYMSAASKGEAWVWRNDGGANFNGFQMDLAYWLGYRPPVMYGLQDIAFGMGLRSWLFDVASRSAKADKGWGSDDMPFRMNLRFVWRFTAWSSLAVRGYIGGETDWTSASRAAHRYFEFREYERQSFVFGLRAAYVHEW